MLDTFDPLIGYRIAERMGLDISKPLGLFGADGHVYKLGDGRVLKISFREEECAVSKILFDLYQTKILPDFLPEVYLVDIDHSESSENEKVYIIIRENIEDFNPPCDPEDWQLIMDEFKAIWSYRGHAMKAFLKEWDKTPEIGFVLREIHKVANILLKTYGVMVHDLKDDNIGVLSNGCLTIRDMGQCKPPTSVLKAVRARDFPCVELSLARTF